MLSSIRKVQKWLLVVVTVIICIAFAYMAKSDISGQSGYGALTFAGKTYRKKELGKLANYFSICFQDLGFGQQGFTKLGNFAFGLNQDGRDRTGFVVSLLTMREECKQLGITASVDEIKALLESLPQFTNEATGKFDITRYEDYKKNLLGRYAMTGDDLQLLFADAVKYDKLRQLVASGVKPTKFEVDLEYGDRYEELTAFEVFKKVDFEEGIEITEEAMKKDFEEQRETLQSGEKRGIGYVFFATPPKTEIQTQEQWDESRKQTAQKFNDLYAAIGVAMDEEDKTFEEAIAAIEDQDSIEAVEPFEATSPPDSIEGEAKLIEGVFKADKNQENAMGTAQTDKGIYLFWLNDVEKPRALTYEEAKERVEKSLRAREVASRQTKASDELSAKVQEGLDAGLDVIAAAKAADAEAKQLNPFNRDTAPEGTEYANIVSAAAVKLEPGQFGEPHFPISGGVVLPLLAKRELPERDTELEDRQRLADSLRARMVDRAFNAWFALRKQDADAQLPQVRMADGTNATISIEDILRARN